jgi:WD40 repeat protein
LLEHVLSLLYDKQEGRDDGLLCWSDYRELGELKGALAKHAEAVFSTLRPNEQRAFPLVMRHLVTLGQGEEEVPNRRTVAYRDMIALGQSDPDVKAGVKGFVDLFIEKRLLVADTDPQGETTVSVAHEALLREWQRVKEWLRENREFLRMRDRLDSSLKLWLSRGKQKDDLLEPGLHLSEGEKLVKNFGLSLGREQTNYIEASIAERNRRKKAQARLRYVLMSAISIFAILAGLQWLRAERQRQSAERLARKAQAEELRSKNALASEAEVAATLREELRRASWASFNQAERQFQFGAWREGIALLARAIKFDPENQVASERFFQELIVHREKILPLPLAIFSHHDAVVEAAFSPDGARVLTAGLDNTAKLWDAVSGELVASFPHQGSVVRVAFSPDGARILTASTDNTAKLWDAASGKLITFLGHQDWVNNAVFSPDGTRILTASADHTAKLWDTTSGKLIASFDHQHEVNDAAFSPDGARILTASRDKTAKIWDAASGELIASFDHQGSVHWAEFSPDGAQILTASADHSAKLWDATSGKLITSFDHQDEVNYAAFSPDGARILTASLDKTAKLWDAASNRLIASFSHEDEVNHAAFSPDGTRILTARKDRTSKLWDCAAGNLIASFVHQDTIEDAAFSVNGARILTASTDHSVNLWDASSGKLIASFVHLGWPWHAGFSPDGARVLTASMEFYKVPLPEGVVRMRQTGGLTAYADIHRAQLWDAVSGKLIASFEHQDELRDAAFSPDGARILTASADQSAKLWEASSGKLLASFEHQDHVTRAAFSPDGTRLLTTSQDNTAKLWDAVSCKLLATFAHRDSVWFGTFSPDGARILTAGPGRIANLWDAASGKLIATFQHLDPMWEKAAFLETDRPMVRFSADGARVLAPSGDRTAKLWDAASGQLVASFDHQGEVFQAEFSSDGTRILTASADHSAKIWDAASGNLLASFTYPNGLTHAAFSPNSARVVTAGADSTAKLWDTASSKLIASFDHQDTVGWAGFSPDGARILTTSLDKTAKLWDASTAVDLARQVKETRSDTATTSSSVSASSSVFQVEALSAVASGLQFSEDGSLVPVNEDRRLELAQQLKRSAQYFGSNARFVRWFSSTGTDRTIFPASDVKIAEWVDNALLTNPNLTEEWVRNALVFLPGHPLLHIALAGFENDSKRGEFLCSFGLSRLPNNGAVCRRAGEMLLAQHWPELALAALDKAPLIDPTDLAAQGLRRQALDAMTR